MHITLTVSPDPSRTNTARPCSTAVIRWSSFALTGMLLLSSGCTTTPRYATPADRLSPGALLKEIVQEAGPPTKTVELNGQPRAVSATGYINYSEDLQRTLFDALAKRKLTGSWPDDGHARGDLYVMGSGANSVVLTADGYVTPTEAPVKLEKFVVTSTRDSIPEPTNEVRRTRMLTVFFATDRAPMRSQSGLHSYGIARGDKLRYGICHVSVTPRSEGNPTAVQSVLKVLSLSPELKDESDFLIRVSEQSREKFFSSLKSKQAGHAGRSAFIFVHGFRVRFEEAARSTARLAYDLDFAGTPVFYSWPSIGELKQYNADENNAEWTVANLKAFLQDFSSNSGVEDIYLIAHSMGSRALTRALLELRRENPSLLAKFKAIVLAAPDIDTAIFTRDIAPTFSAPPPPVTLYASATDKALQLSQIAAGNYPRLGDTRSGVPLFPGVETVDATGIDLSLIGHSYFAEAKAAIADIAQILRGATGASDRRGLHTAHNTAPVYWKFGQRQ